jgi:hypothetical protein
MSNQDPQDVCELSRHRYEQALGRVEAALTIGWSLGDPDLLNEMRIIRMVALNRLPWWGMTVDPEDSSVTVGVVLRNAFNAVGDVIDWDPTGEKLVLSSSRHWLTRRYLPLWRQGRREYLEWLDTLGLSRPPDESQ